MRLPRAPLYPMALVAQLWARVAGGEPMLTVDGLTMASHWMYFDSSKAQRVLGYTARPWQQAVAEAIAWFRLEGMLR